MHICESPFLVFLPLAYLLRWEQFYSCVSCLINHVDNINVCIGEIFWVSLQTTVISVSTYRTHAHMGAAEIFVGVGKGKPIKDLYKDKKAPYMEKMTLHKESKK